MLNKFKNKIKLPQNSKLRALLFLAILIIAVAVIYVVLNGRSSDAALGGTSISPANTDNIDSTPGQKNLSKAYLQTLLKENKIESTNALKQGQSYLPTMVNTGDSYVKTNSFKAKSEDCPCCNKQQASGSLLDQLVKKGKISPDTAADLQRLANQGASVQDYANELQQLVKEGKLTPAQAQALLASYKADHAKKAANESGPTSPDDVANQLLASGKVSPATASAIKALATKNLSPGDYKAALDRLVREGKITPAQEEALLAAYRAKHAASAYTPNANSTIDPTLAEMAADASIDPATAKDLEDLSNANAPVGQYAAELNRLVREGKLTPAQAQALLAAYKSKHGTPQEQSQAAKASGLDQMAAAQQLAAQQAQQQASAQMAAAQRQQQQMQAQQQLQATQSSMSAQANRLFASWNAPTPTHDVVLTPADTKTMAGVQAGSAGASAAATAIPMIKAGTIMFAVLDTALNSDEPGPVMATIVAGKYKGAKLIGGLTRQNDRVMLQFNLMSMKDWTGTVKMNAVAVNPDTARTALASSVNHHYLSRYGSLFGAAFLASYAEALDDNGTTTITPLGTVQRTVSLSPAGRVMKGLGGVAQSLSTAIQQNFNRPPTVKVDSGVGLGVLFQEDVSKPTFLQTSK